MDYFEVDVTQGWKWDNYDVKLAKTIFDKYIFMRGDAAHQANTSNNPNCKPHSVKTSDLDKATHSRWPEPRGRPDQPEPILEDLKTKVRKNLYTT